jgi:hypothetical protein
MHEHFLMVRVQLVVMVFVRSCLEFVKCSSGARHVAAGVDLHLVLKLTYLPPRDPHD